MVINTECHIKRGETKGKNVKSNWSFILKRSREYNLNFVLHLFCTLLRVFLTCYSIFFICLAMQEPTRAPPPMKTKTQAIAASDAVKKPQKPATPPYSPTQALLRLLQTAFNRQSPTVQQSPTAGGRQHPGRGSSLLSTRIPPQKLYQALDMIDKYAGPGHSVYSDYSDGFYSAKPYRHRDDRLLQALFQMIDDDQKWERRQVRAREDTRVCLCVGWEVEGRGQKKIKNERRIKLGI